MVMWICSRNLFKTSCEGFHEVLPIVIAEESRINCSYRIHTYTSDDHGELFWSGFG